MAAPKDILVNRSAQAPNHDIAPKAALSVTAKFGFQTEGMSAVGSSRNEICEIPFRTDRVRPSEEHNNTTNTTSRTRSRWNSDLPQELVTTC
jgi:hypothetical protein